MERLDIDYALQALMYEHSNLRRERIATAALQGMLARESGYEAVASDAVRYADALIAELDKPGTVPA